MTSTFSSLRPVLFFDVDGTLFDTRPLVRAAYRAANVDMPRGAWGRPWREWLPGLFGGDVDRARERHAVKNEAYLRLLRTHRPRRLPLYWIALGRFSVGEDVRLVTAASETAARALLDGDPLAAALAACEADVDRLVAVLRESSRPRVLVDDDARRLQAVRDAEPDVAVYRYRIGDTYSEVLAALSYATATAVAASNTYDTYATHVTCPSDEEVSP